MIEKIIHDYRLQEFCSYVKAHNLNMGAKMIGLDLNQDYVNVKIYTELLQIPAEEIVSKFLETNVATEFFKWVPHWDKRRDSGLAFGLKVDVNRICKKYFHIKFGPCYDQMLFDKQFFFLQLLKINTAALLKGISYEITGDKFYQKFYVYIKDPIEIEKVLTYKKMKRCLNLDEIEELELYATENSFKINIINKMDNFFTVKQDVWQVVPEELKCSLKECCRILKREPVYTGVTSSGVVSAYFSFTKSYDNILNL